MAGMVVQMKKKLRIIILQAKIKATNVVSRIYFPAHNISSYNVIDYASSWYFVRKKRVPVAKPEDTEVQAKGKEEDEVFGTYLCIHNNPSSVVYVLGFMNYIIVQYFF